MDTRTVLEIAAGHWPFSGQFQHLADQKFILVGQIYCTFSMGQQSKTYKMSDFQENGRPISDPYFYHCTYIWAWYTGHIRMYICKTEGTICYYLATHTHTHIYIYI